MLNLEKIIEESKGKTKEHIVSSSLLNIKRSKNIDTQSTEKNCEIELSNIRGKPTRLSFNPNQNNISVSADDMKTIQSNFKLSQRTTLGIAVYFEKQRGVEILLRKI